MYKKFERERIFYYVHEDDVEKFLEADASDSGYLRQKYSTIILDSVFNSITKSKLPVWELINKALDVRK